MVGPIIKPLAYRLRKSVHYSQRNGAPFLVLDFPLKTLRLNPFWIPLLETLSGDLFIPLEHLATLASSVPADKCEFFLNSLVEKGFLEFEGISPLSEFPFVSIIIPVRNRPEAIAACLESLLHIDYPAEKLEILVIDDNSTDRTPEVVSGFPVRLIALKEHKQASYCRNLAAREARGEILAFIDSDCLAEPLWLKELVPAFKDPNLGAVGGVVEAFSGDNGLDRYEEVKSSLKIGSWFKRSIKEDRFFYLPSCNLLVIKTHFLKLGGFREDLFVGEDVDVCWRLQDDGFPVEYRPQGTVYHQHRNSLWPFCLRRFQYGTSEPWLQRWHSRRRKQLLILPAESLFWIFLISGIIFVSWPLLGVSSGIFLLDTIIRFIALSSRRIPLGFKSLLLAGIREYLAFFYHWAAFFSRYYLFVPLLIFPFLPMISLALIGLHLLNGAVEYFIKKPRLNFFSFLFYFTLDQLAYQAGVWWGCLKNRCFHPVNPVLTFKSVFREG
ncbi:MAG: mycofactocin biosynthesis glycosyltransferase MftF [Deltaproteobacteria bacterium]|nr:mycofactocin biosynthesis glycosyltransferase MftF [Deltaproteobacteria bacterium]